ncbi:MAG TPA: porin, partial [Gammaproteobacteria bacterium]|nr:porin [Gammaproteobacteria bacterium]
MQRIAFVLGAALGLIAGGPAWGQSAPHLGAASGGASSAEVTSGNRFNPDLSVILEGIAYADDRSGDADALVAAAAGINQAHGHDAGGHAGEEPGFSLKPTELAVSASVDPYFDAFVHAVITEAGGMDLEEAYFTTRALPAGLQVKAGRFLSGIGYHNDKHRHQWQFVEQTLPYQQLLGAHGLRDTGVQLTWTPATPFYTRFGVEALQGDQEVVGRFDGESALDGVVPASVVDRYGDPKAGPRLFTAFAKAAPNLGYSHELQAGVFGVYASDHQELHTDPDDHILTGQYWLAGTDWVYAYDAPHQYGRGDLKISAEYLY